MVWLVVDFVGWFTFQLVPVVSALILFDLVFSWGLIGF